MTLGFLAQDSAHRRRRSSVLANLSFPITLVRPRGLTLDEKAFL